MKTALIIGAGPAGLTAALELLRTTDIKPVIVESENFVGGISRTAVHNGNRMDIGGHRFFSKSDVVMDWWTNILRLQGAPSRDDLAIGRRLPTYAGGPDPEKEDRVMLVRSRLSRILYTRKLFDYPVSLNATTIRNLGLLRMMKIGMSYLKVCVLPKREEKSLEDFMINRFGVELYRTFFRDYTEKVWGIPCNEISADWGAQRIKGLSIAKTLLHAFKALLPQKKSSVRQKDTETSLISEFLYPKLGPGELWETVADMVREKGGEIHLGAKVVKFTREGNRITGADVQINGRTETISADYFLSTMPVKNLVAALPDVPEDVRRVADGLVYRDFMTVGLLLDSIDIRNPAKPGTPESKLKFVADNWIYVQESDVKLGRIQVFNNWSPYLDLRLACDKIMKAQGYPEHVGGAKLTLSYNLPCAYVIHTVGPTVTGLLTQKQIDQLSSCYTSCLDLAEANELTSVAFCCISTGVFHFPNAKACSVAVDTVRSWFEEHHGSEMKVLFNVFKEEDFDLYSKEISR